MSGAFRTRVLQLLDKNGRLTRAEIRAATHASERSVRGCISECAELGMVGLQAGGWVQITRHGHQSLRNYNPDYVPTIARGIQQKDDRHAVRLAIAKYGEDAGQKVIAGEAGVSREYVNHYLNDRFKLRAWKRVYPANFQQWANDFVYQFSRVGREALGLEEAPRTLRLEMPPLVYVAACAVSSPVAPTAARLALPD